MMELNSGDAPGLGHKLDALVNHWRRLNVFVNPYL
jgi:hypothetical protein